MQGYVDGIRYPRDTPEGRDHAFPPPIAQAVQIAQGVERLGSAISKNQHAVGRDEIPRQTEILAAGIDEAAGMKGAVHEGIAIEPDFTVRKAFAYHLAHRGSPLCCTGP